MIGLGAQDDFAYAYRFLDEGDLTAPTMLWDPSFTTWQAFGVQANSQMMVLTPDLAPASQLIYGFSEDQRSAILDFASSI